MSPKYKVLYISYDGMTDPLGQSQVLSYLKVLSQNEFSFHILSYEKKERYTQFKSFVEDFIRGFDIQWHPLPYTNSPPILSTINNIRKGKKRIKQLAGIHNFKIVHCRGYIPSIMGEWLKKRTGARFIFDMRGWWPDEKKEAGDWASPVYTPVYSFFKRREKGFFRNSDMSISLTGAGKEFITANKLKQENDVEVIPTCVNFEIFPAYDPFTRDKIRNSLQLPADSLVMVYSGSLGGNYRTDLLIKYFRFILYKRPDSFFLFITHSSPELLEKEISVSSISKDRFRRVQAAYTEVSQYLMAGDIGMVMYNTGFSVIGRSPTKLGEYWACGLKTLSARGIGDLDYLIKKYPGGGVLAESLNNDNNLKDAAEKILETTVSKEDLRRFSMDYFDLNKGCEQYLKCYRRVIKE